MKMSAKRVVLLMGSVLLLDANLVWAEDPGDDTAKANVTVTVNTIMEWSEDSYTDITLTPAIAAKSDAPWGSTNFTLYTNCNCEISADIVGTEAQLTLGTDPNQTLVTSYKLTDDGDGTGTGGTDQAGYTEYSLFLSPAYTITHVAGDGVVVITLYAKAENPSEEVADAGAYSATQTLTASWTSD